MTPLRLSRSQCERAVAAYLDAAKAGTAHAEVPVNVRMGELDAEGNFKLNNIEELPIPCIAVSAPRAEQHAMGYSIVELHVAVLGSINSETSAAHVERVGWVAERLEQLANDPAPLNQPASGPDNRVVKDFRAFGIEVQDETGQEVEQAFVDDFAFRFHCQPTDDVSG